MADGIVTMRPTSVKVSYLRSVGRDAEWAERKSLGAAIKGAILDNPQLFVSWLLKDDIDIAHRRKCVTAAVLAVSEVVTSQVSNITATVLHAVKCTGPDTYTSRYLVDMLDWPFSSRSGGTYSPANVVVKWKVK